MFSSGDTGVSATLVLRGTPPFQVYYRMQRDNEPPRELHKTFTSARGELTLQPERSGHYTFTFVQLSDANYKRVELTGPTIEQVVHPLATADFAANQREYGRGKRTISSCSGNTVSVDVDLKVCCAGDSVYVLYSNFVGNGTLGLGSADYWPQNVGNHALREYRNPAKSATNTNSKGGG